MSRALACVLVVTFYGCGIAPEDEEPPVEGPTATVEAAITTRSLKFGRASRIPYNGDYVDVCSSGGSSCTSVQLNPRIAGPPGYSVRTSCSYGQGCLPRVEYRGATIERCRYGEGCFPIPTTLPRGEERCLYGSGCELFPVFGR
jgi:hypothetical protein